MSLDIDEIFKCRDITNSSLELYKTKLRILNDNRPIKNLNYLYDIDKINEKIKGLKENTKRTYIIAITSILSCLNKEQMKPNKKIKKLYQAYSKILDDYNTKLKDQTEITEGTQVISKEKIDEVYNNLKNNRDTNTKFYQDYLILSLYTLLPPRRNMDYQKMKYVKNFSPELSKEFNYYDKDNFYFNAYKTRGKYALVEIKVPDNLKEIIDFHIKSNKIEDDDFILRDFKNGTELKRGNEITLILNRIFKSKVGASMLRRSFLTNKYGNTNNEMINDAKNMSTSVDVIQSNYIKKNKKSK